MKHATRLLWIVMAVFVIGHARAHAWPSEDEYKYHLAVKAARSGRVDFAYLHFRGILESFPASRHRKTALFASAEYFYEIPDYKTARRYLEEFINSYPDTPEVLLAMIMSYDIAQKAGRDDEAAKLKKQIIHLSNSRRTFQDTDVYRYKSPLSRRYEVRFGGDRVLLLKNDTPLILIVE